MCAGGQADLDSCGGMWKIKSLLVDTFLISLQFLCTFTGDSGG